MPYYRSKKYRSGNRVYNTELAISEVGVRQIRSEEQSIHQLMRMSASQVYRVELYVSGKGRAPYNGPKGEETRRIVDTYGLVLEGSLYRGDPIRVYDILRSTYPSFEWERFPNHDGKGYKRLTYAVMYGDAPCTVISGK